MSDLFLSVLNLSYCALWVVPPLLLARLVLRKAPRSLICGLWAILALRLLLGGIAAPFSLIPSTELIPPESLFDQLPGIRSGFSSIDQVINPIYSEALRPTLGESINPLQLWIGIYANLWVLGMAAMALWALISCLRIRHRVRETVPLGGNVYLCDRIPAPFLFGILRPRIYLPSTLCESARSHVLAHERAHIRRLDHWWKPLGFLLLTIHWFNPAIWLCYVLLCRDIELACDEHVAKGIPLSERKAYSAALLECSLNRRSIAACPLAFGEVGVKQRIKSVLRYKKPALWVILAASIVAIALSAVILADPTEPSAPSTVETPSMGITLRVENITPSGATLVCTRDGALWNEVSTGSAWNLERLEDSQWIGLMPESTVWTTIAYLLNPNSTTSWDINWSSIVGELPPGHYRISKFFTAKRTPMFTLGIAEETAEQTCCAEFTIS